MRDARLRTAAVALLALAAAPAADARARFVCPQAEVIEVNYPADHRAGPDLILLRYRGQAWRLREVSGGKSADRATWRGNARDAGADPGMVWMETGDRGVLLRNGTVAAGPCERDTGSAPAAPAPHADSAARDAAPTPPVPAEPPRLPDRASLERGAPCYRQWRLLSGYRRHGDRWMWHGIDENRGRYRVEAEGADAATFRLLSPDLAVDATALFVKGRRRTDIDRASLRWLGGAFFADRRRVYFDCGNMHPLWRADVGTFEPLEFPWARDRLACYHQHEKVAGCRPDSLAPVNGEYAHDGRRVFFRTLVVPGADPASFRADARNPGLARDAASRYEYGRANGAQ